MELLSKWIASCISKTHFFFLTDLFCRRKNTPDLFCRQSSRGQRLSIIPWRVQDPRVKAKVRDWRIVSHRRADGRTFLQRARKEFFFLTVWPQSLWHNSVVPQYHREVMGIGVATNNSLDLTHRLSFTNSYYNTVTSSNSLLIMFWVLV